MNIEIIEVGDMEFVPRGRTSLVPQELVDALKKIGKGKALKLTDMKVDVSAKTYKTDKARVSATIRQAAKQAGVSVEIRWSQAGIPQVVKK
jgi:hypothetical protein